MKYLVGMAVVVLLAVNACVSDGAAVQHYHPVTGEYRGSSTAKVDPVAGTPMVPGNATLSAVPAASNGFARVWQSSTWVQVEDHRGETWYTPERVAVVLTDLGVVPSGYTATLPPIPFDAAGVSNAVLGVANDLVFSMWTATEQRQMLARAVEIADAKASGTATAEEIAESEQIRAIWSAYKKIRARSVVLIAHYVSLGENLTDADLAAVLAELKLAAVE